MKLFNNQISTCSKRATGFRSLMLLVFLLAFCAVSCSSTNWVVITEEANDENEFEVIDTEYYLDVDTSLTTNQPILYFDLKTINTLEYTQRVQVERFVQRYQPRVGYVLLGIVGAGLSTYAAFSDQLITEPTKPQKYALLGAGGVLTGLSFINMRPVGEPAKTGETRLLRKTGTAIRTDTSMAVGYGVQNSSLKMYYNDSVFAEEVGLNISEGRIAINLADEVNPSLFEQSEEDEIVVEVTVDSISQKATILVSSFLEQFVIVESQVSPLRNLPVNNPDNILIDLAQNSQLRLVSREDGWYKVMYGISETWLKADDGRVVWRPSEFASNLSIITVPETPFGSIDVERNIPVFASSTQNSKAFILSNYNYEGDFSEKIYGSRDVQLMQAYFRDGFGIPTRDIIKATNISTNRQTEEAFARLSGVVTDSSSTLLVYLSGYAIVQDSMVYLSGVVAGEDETSLIDLKSLFRNLDGLPSKSIIIFAELDFINNNDLTDQLMELSSIITAKDNRAVFFAARPDQRSGIYSSSSGAQNQHSIFTYYIAEAFQQRKMRLNDIYNHIGRNVTFTSRSIYDRPQNPLFFGNGDLQIVE
jgi:hypothetical protein